MAARSRGRVNPQRSSLCWICWIYRSTKYMGDPAADTTTPSDSPSSWVAEPTQRGSYGIISLCLSTLLISIWSTLHFNVPTRRCSTTRRFFFQVLWMLIALVVPEILLCSAIHERLNARNLVKKVLEFHPDLRKPRMHTRIYNWFRRLVDVSA
jgi:hypothetical protein